MSADRAPARTVLALAGSLRAQSWNRRLLEAAAESAPGGMTVNVYAELGSVPLFNEDLEDQPGDVLAGVRQLVAQVATADGLLIATPEYNQSIPGVLKNAIDWLSRPAAGDVLANKPVAIIGATSGRWGTRLAQSALRQVLYATGSLVLPQPAMFVREVDRLFDPTGRLTDPPTREALSAAMTAFATWIDRSRR